MKNLIILVVVLAVIAAGVAVAFKLRVTAKATNAASAEFKGDYKEAAAQYTDALNKLIPAVDVPDVNHSKVFSQAAWKKEMERYAARLSGTSAAGVDRARRNALLDAANRNAARIHENNFTSNDSRKKISAEQQYAALWNSAFFAAGIKPDSSHRSLAASCYGKNISFLKISALTSYIYDVTLIDTVADRRTSFTVYPESSTFILATPGMHLLICKSSFQPAPGQLWRSAPTIIPLMVPQSPSLVSFTLETRVVREKGKE